MKKNPMIAAALAVAFAAGGVFSVPVYEIVHHPVTASAAVTDTVPQGYTPIYTIDDLYAVRNDLSGSYILMNDIDMSETAPGGDWDCGYGWKALGGNGEAYFTGVFDGNGYAIKNMHIYGNPDETNIGLFGRTSTSGSIEHLSMIDCDINLENDLGTITSTGCIAGRADHVSECYVTGNITVKPKFQYHSSLNISIGGIVGFGYNFNDCYNACDISFNLEGIEKTSDLNALYYYIGGIVGDGSNGCNLTCCYNVGDIEFKVNEAVDYTPQIGYISAGSFGAIKSCFYLKKDTDYTASAYNDNSYKNVVGLTKGQMKSQAAYTGFDFENVWTIDPTAEYPYPTLRNVPYVSSEEPATEPTTEETTEPSTTPATEPATSSAMKGDINEDGVVNASDAAIILIYSAMIGAGEEVSIDDLY